MAYFTTILQKQVNDIWRQKIEDADRRMQLYKSGKEIRDFLNNRATLNTASFVIRRFIQISRPDLLNKVRLTTGCDFADLQNNLNLPWEESFNKELARELHLLSKERGINISRTTWISYLNDAPIKMYKDTPFKVAFALSMNVDTTEELLMACGQDIYCFRNPEHFIYYYCQNRFNAFNWSRACSLIYRYRNGLKNNVYTANDASKGMTHLLRSDLKNLLSTNLTEEAADDALINYMLEHQQEFSGLSLTARNDFLRMAQYLAVLYPTYSKIIRKKDSLNGEIEEKVEELPVSFLPDGTPKFGELVRALFSTGGWLSTTVGKDSSDNMQRTFSSRKRRLDSSAIEYHRAEINEDDDRPFLNSVQFFVDNYAHHLDAIERVFRRPSNPGNVDRRDVILFTYFFIRKYPELLEDEEQYNRSLDRLTEMVYEDQHIDACMDYLMEELYNISAKKFSEKNTGTYDEGSDAYDYIMLFNEVLEQFGMKGMYMPNPWDRFIIMSLFAEDPDFFTEAVLWNTVDDSNEDDEDPTLVLSENEELPTDDLKAEHYQQPVPERIVINDPSAFPLLKNTDGSRKFIVATLFRKLSNEYIAINKNCFIIGRSATSSQSVNQDYGFPTEDKNISRRHAAILFFSGGFYLSDISSLSLTRLNSIHIKKDSGSFPPSGRIIAEAAHKLYNGDHIQIGNEEFVFTI